MAHRPRRSHPPHQRNEWLHFFFGHPVRFLWTAAGILFIIALVFPQLAQRALYNALSAFLGAVTPLLEPLLAGSIMVLGIAMILGAVFKPKKKKKGH